MKIMVLNCFSRNSLAVINSLDPSYELIGGAAKKEHHPFFQPERIFKSKRLKAVFRYADPEIDAERFKNDIMLACHRYRLDAIIPTGTTITNYLSFYKGEITDKTETRLLVEDYSRLSQLADKWHTYTLCKQAMVPTPKSGLLHPDPENVEWLCSFNFPVVVKPRTSFAAKGVLFINSRKELEDYIRKGDNCGGQRSFSESPLMVQECIQGELRDVTSCSKEGKVISLLTQQRLVSLYDFGGGGIINKTTFEPVMMHLAEKIIRFIGWNGVMLFDFVKDTQDNYFLLECNPKIWGTTQLTVEAGLNVIQQLVDLFVFERELTRKGTYEIDLLYRWLFPECFYHWVQKPRTWRHISKRVLNTFRTYDAKRSINNVNCRNLLHLIGIIMEKSEV